MIVAFAGLPGTGKSTLAQALAGRLPAVVLDKDRIRAALFLPSLIDYTKEQDDFCMDVLYRTAAYLHQSGRVKYAIIDGRTFSRPSQVAELIHMSQEIGASLRLIECVCSDSAAKARLDRDREAGSHLAANRSFALYLALKEQAQPIPPPKLVLHTDQEDLGTCVRRIVAFLQPAVIS